MTESAPAKRKPGSAPVFWISVALFCVLLGLLTHRLAGESGAEGAAAEPPRKVIVRRVVTTIVPAAPGAGGASAAATPVTGPVETVPAEAPAEPDPVTTSTS